MALDVPLALTLYRPALFAAWLSRLLGTTFNHSSALAHPLGSPTADGRPDLPDSCFASEQLLKAAKALGWITGRDGISPEMAARLRAAQGAAEDARGVA